MGDLNTGSLYTDFYQLTMAQLYFSKGMHETTARFEHFFRNYPDYGEHQAGYCINAGLGTFIDWLEECQLTSRERKHLENQTNAAGKDVFSEEFLDWLSKQNPKERLTIESIPEGKVVHPNVPLTIVEGPLALAQLVETPLLNMLNYQTLIATKASRIRRAGESNLLLEFGMRRGHDRGANAGARASLIGGADFSSNTGQSYELGFPPKGTHAHSMVQAFIARGDSELDAFRAFAEEFPDQCILLVDTVDTIESGIPNAITVFKELRQKGYEPVGIRLDSGDLAHLAVRAARMLNDAGFEDVSIVLSNQLDERVLTQIVQQIREEAPDYDLDPASVVNRLAYGVGTRLITSRGDASLGGVYKLVALKDDQWTPVLKISENPAKVPTPGRKQCLRVYDSRKRATVDVLAGIDEEVTDSTDLTLHHPNKEQLQRRLEASEISMVETLHETVLEQGDLHWVDDIQQMRDRREGDLDKLDPGVKRIMNPHRYHVSLTKNTWTQKQELMQKIHGASG
ncbi:MAG: nicotinate phosphoribosyltransferase [bacterium]